MEQSSSPYGLQFYLLCASSVLFMASFNMLIPELPSYLIAMGGEEHIGLIIGLFTVGAATARPFSAKLADTIGRLPVMIFGALVCVVMGLIYPFVGTVFGFLMLRLFHGLSTGFKPTGTTAYLADIIPPDRRGQAMGYLGIAGSVGFAAGPAIGGFMGQAYDIEVLFYASSVSALLSILVIIGMKETRKPSANWRRELITIRGADFVEWRVYPPALVMMLTGFSFGAVVTLIPMLSDHVGVSNRGWFYTVYVLVSITVRVVSGRMSDRHGRAPVLVVGISILMLGMVMTALASNELLFFAAAILVGLSVGINAPTIFAWTVDLSHPDFKGRGLSTMYIAMEIGIGIGAFSSAAMYANDSTHFFDAFMLCAGMALLALIFTISFMAQERKKAKVGRPE